MIELVGRDARPALHPRPASGWVNDPHAGVRLDGTFHLFCQWNPDSTRHENVHWAHLTSSDLVHWEVHPPALAPTPGGPDADGCWSGCAVLDGDDLTLVYTGFRRDQPLQTVCVARSTDAARWRKDAGNPVLPAPPPELDVVEFRDPYVWRTSEGPDGEWSALLGAALSDGTAAALLYRSPDLVRWHYRGVFCDSSHPLLAQARTGAAWECPQLLVDGENALLVVAAWPREPSHAVAIGGRLAGDRLEPRFVQRLDAGPDLYAPALARDVDGRALLWGWSWEARSPERSAAQGWAGALTFPRTVRLGPDGRPRFAPAAELLALRAAPLALDLPARGQGPGQPAQAHLLHPDPGAAFELEALLDPAAGTTCFLRLLADPGGREQVEVGLRRDAEGGVTAYVDRHLASTDPAAAGGSFSTVLPPGEGPVPVRVFVDHSLLEVFVADVATFTVRVYPQLPQSTALLCGTTGGAGGLLGLTAWPLAL